MKKKTKQLTLSQATKIATERASKTRQDWYVVAKRSMGDYTIVVMSERHFHPFTRLKKTDKFHDILRTRSAWKLGGWTKDNNQCGMDKHWPAAQ